MKKQYKYYDWSDGTLTKEVLDSIKVGDKIKCNIWKQGMIVKAVSKNYIIMSNAKYYSICEKLPKKYTHNAMMKGMFTIGPDNYYTYYDYCEGKEEELQEALIRLEDGYTKDCFNYDEWAKTANPISIEKGTLEISRRGISLNKIWIKRK